MKGQKKKKIRQQSPLVKPQKTSMPPKYKFYITYDNLKCFINPNQQPKRKINRQTPKKPLPAMNKLPIKQINHSKEKIQQKTQEKQQELFDDGRIWRTFSECSNVKNLGSYASTADIYGNYYGYNIGSYSSRDSYEFLSTQLSTNGPSISESFFKIDQTNIINDPRTTIMIKNIPNKYSIQDLSSQIDQSLSNTYDFLYLPCDLKNQCNVGYGFINFIDTCYLQQFYHQFHNKKWVKFRSQKICKLTYARLQGLQSLIEHFQNSKVLNQKDKKYRPIIREFSNIQHLIRKQQQQDDDFQPLG